MAGHSWKWREEGWEGIWRLSEAGNDGGSLRGCGGAFKRERRQDSGGGTPLAGRIRPEGAPPWWCGGGDGDARLGGVGDGVLDDQVLIEEYGNEDGGGDGDERTDDPGEGGPDEQGD